MKQVEILHIDGQDLVLPSQRPYSAPSTAKDSDVSMVSVSIVTRKGDSIISQEGSTTFPLPEGELVGFEDEMKISHTRLINSRVIYVYIACSTLH